MKKQSASRKIIAFIISSLLLMLSIAWVPVALASTYSPKAHVLVNEKANVLTSGTPTVDPTVVALQKEQLQNQNNWLWSFGSAFLSPLALLIAAIFGLYQWFKDRQQERAKQTEVEKHLREDRRIEREKRSEERFQSVIEGLGKENQAAKIGAAIMLRTFLSSDYAIFYNQAFDLAVANLRTRPINLTNPQPQPQDSLNQALTTVFKESFPLARDRLKANNQQFSPEYLNAANIQLDNSYLEGADLADIWMPEAYLRASNLTAVCLNNANLSNAHLSRANLSVAQLAEATLINADLSWANLSHANLVKAQLKNAVLTGTDMAGADLTGSDLTGANPETANSLRYAKMINVIGLTPNQLAICASKEAII